MATADNKEVYTREEVLEILYDFNERAIENMNVGFLVLNDIDDLLPDDEITKMEVRFKKRVRRQILKMGNWVINETANLIREFGGQV